VVVGGAFVVGNVNVWVLIWPTSAMSVEHIENGETELRCPADVDTLSADPLGVVTTSADRRSGSASPAVLRRTRQEGLKPSSTEPQLSSSHGDQSQELPVRYAVLIRLGLLKI